MPARRNPPTAKNAQQATAFSCGLRLAGLRQPLPFDLINRGEDPWEWLTTEELIVRRSMNDKLWWRWFWRGALSVDG